MEKAGQIILSGGRPVGICGRRDRRLERQKSCPFLGRQNGLAGPSWRHIFPAAADLGPPRQPSAVRAVLLIWLERRALAEHGLGDEAPANGWEMVCGDDNLASSEIPAWRHPKKSVPGDSARFGPPLLPDVGSVQILACGAGEALNALGP